MAEIVMLVLTLSNTTPMQFCCVTENRFLLDLEVAVTEGGGFRADDTLRFSFRNLFTDEIASCDVSLSDHALEASKVRIRILPEDIALTPGTHHVRADLLRGGAPMCGPFAGSAELYVCREGESPSHAIASFFLSRVAYSWSPERAVYHRSIPTRLPATGDPFFEGFSEEFWKKIGGDWELHPELLHDGGIAFLHAARVYRATGQPERAAFCETVVKRTIESIFTEMIDDQGRLHAVRWSGEEKKDLYHIRQQDGFVLKFMSQAYLHFRDVADDAGYADALFARMKPMADYQFSQPNPLGCGGGCKVYDGRILAGLGFYCLTERGATGQFNDEHVKTALDFARRAARHLLGARGWYDEGCYVEGKCHIGFGNQNIMGGMAPCRRVALAIGDEDTADYLGEALMAGLDFLARTNGKLTGYIQWIPARHSGWANGHMHEVLEEMLDQGLATSDFQKEQLDWYLKNLWVPRFDYWVLAFHRCNIMATVIMESDEYKRPQ